ncbi:hypothetical protein J437_LFUL018586 [Ladona fulva]|uniref:Integrase catalytic domain-containing protein n=1 Tax=Ladona fulva TaxID=123851 RepID=A0A8K0PCV3_LADFU|nr:hypothetical protein J437_LFUL018586 [Ladona fulva]
MSIGETYLNAKVTEWVEGLDAYTLHKPVRRKFARNRYQITNIDDLWQCDLIDMRNLEDQVLLKTDRKPNNIQTDKGSEFTSRLVKKFFKENGVNYFVTQNPVVKASIVERFNRTLKTRMWRFFTENNTRRYIEILPKLLHGCNHAYHSSIKMAPADVNEKKCLSGLEKSIW